jgi:hypothetical protein
LVRTVLVLRLKSYISLAIVLILCLLVFSIIVLQPNDEEVEKAVSFLVSRFNPQENLCCEAPRVANNTYWLVSDNLWAYKALEMMDVTGKSSLIKAELIELAQVYSLPTDAQGLPISCAHEAVIGDSVSIPFRASTNCTLYRNDYVLNMTMLNGTIMNDWRNYADLLLYAALSCHWQGNDTAAHEYFEEAKGMWDGIGINDTVTKAGDLYGTYKLALLLYTSKVLGEQLPFKYDLVDRIWSLQRESDGGIITDYFADGTAHGDANTETTSIVIIAISKREELPFPILFGLAVVIVTLLAVMVYVRRRKRNLTERALV